MRVKLLSGILLLGLGVFIVLAAGLMTGCASSQAEEESTLPWATPASWEGSLLPGIAPNYSERRDY